MRHLCFLYNSMSCGEPGVIVTKAGQIISSIQSLYLTKLKERISDCIVEVFDRVKPAAKVPFKIDRAFLPHVAFKILAVISTYEIASL